MAHSLQFRNLSVKMVPSIFISTCFLTIVSVKSTQFRFLSTCDTVIPGFSGFCSVLEFSIEEQKSGF